MHTTHHPDYLVLLDRKDKSKRGFRLTQLAVSDIIAPAAQIGADAFDYALIKTWSGNVYLLIKYFGQTGGAVINGKTGTTVLLTPEKAKELTVTVGKPFTYGTAGGTTRVVEIVASHGRRYNQQGDSLNPTAVLSDWLNLASQRNALLMYPEQIRREREPAAP